MPLWRLCITLTLERIQITIDRSQSCRSSVKSLSAKCTRRHIHSCSNTIRFLSTSPTFVVRTPLARTCLMSRTPCLRTLIRVTGLVFLDLTKAFDTLDHSVVLDKLASLGFSKASVQWFKAYLTDRTQSVVVNRSTYDPQSISFGVPQRSLIGPLLFIIYINDVPSEVKHCKIQLYAKDTPLYVSSSSISDIKSICYPKILST